MYYFNIPFKIQNGYVGMYLSRLTEIKCAFEAPFKITGFVNLLNLF